METRRLRGNFTQLPNRIIEALMKTKLSGTELVIVLTICRDTYGWGRRTKEIGNFGFSKQTGLPRTYVIELIRKLTRLKVIKKYRPGVRYARNSYSINENIGEWQVEFRGGQLGLTSPDQLTCQLQVSTDSQSPLTETSQLEQTQEIKKENKERLEKLKEGIRETLVTVKKVGGND